MARGPDVSAGGVIAEIRRAFSGVSRDDGVTLHEALVIDARGTDAERASARALDLDQRWEDVPDRLIEEHDWTLCFVDPKGFRYYLPAYMVWSLRNYERPEEFDGFSQGHPILSLVLSESVGLRRWCLDRFEMFDAEQARAICRFLRFMARQDELLVCAGEARKALEAYWGRFCEDNDPTESSMTLHVLETSRAAGRRVATDLPSS